MQTDLNKSISKFLSLPVEKITLEEIKKVFSKNDKNDYGNLLHAIVQNKYDEDKVLKFISILLENGYDVNYKSKNTGYNFIQLALYGYTDKDGVDHSYSTDFILKLINISRKYNLDVNTKDNDGDSIVHTAIASEVYTGNILPIIDALGKEFDIECKDNNGNNLNSALKLYIEDAKNSNKEWYDRLIKEEPILSERFELGNDTLEEITLQEQQIKIQLEQIVNNINIKYIVENKEEIFLLKNKLSIVLQKKSILTKKETNFDEIWSKYNELLEHVFNNEINKLSQQKNFNGLKELLIVLKDYNYENGIEKINIILEDYKKLVEKIRTKIENDYSLSNKEKIQQAISILIEADKEELLLLLNDIENKIVCSIEEIKGQNRVLNNIGITNEYINYRNSTLKELDRIFQNNNSLIKSRKKSILNEKKLKLEECIRDILDLEKTGVFNIDELWNTVEVTTNKNKKKVKVKQNKKK